MALTGKQSRFVSEYLTDLCATKAAVRAGYSERSAKEQAHQLLGRDDVAAAIEQAMRDRAQRTQITGDRVVAELVHMALFDPGEIAGAEISGPADIAKLPEAVRRAIVGWSWDRNGNFVLKLSPKTPSLDLLARHLGLLKERVEHTGRDGSPIAFKDYSNVDRAKAMAVLFSELEVLA